MLSNVVAGSYNIICLSETWLLDEIPSNAYFPVFLQRSQERQGLRFDWPEIGRRWMSQ